MFVRPEALQTASDRTNSQRRGSWLYVTARDKLVGLVDVFAGVDLTTSDT